MNIEELKLIIDLVKSLSGDATTALIWYLAFGLTHTVIILSALVGTVLMIIRYFTGMSDWSRAGRRVAKKFGGEGGSYMYVSDERAIDRAIESAK